MEASVSTQVLREKLRNYSLQQRMKVRENASDSVRFGLGEILEKIQELDNLTENDVKGLAMRIKRRKHATEEDMYRLSHAFLQSADNIRQFNKIPGAIQVIVKELTGADSQRQISAIECLCNFSLGESCSCEKLVNAAGSYLVTYLSSTEEQLRRTSLWTMANILATSSKAASSLIQMELVPKLWSLYIGEDCSAAPSDASIDYRDDSAVCLQIISTKAKDLLRADDLDFIKKHLTEKQPTSIGGEYHLQLLFNCEIIKPYCPMKVEHITYLINYALSNLSITSEFSNTANRLRIVYAIRILANLIATQPLSYDLFVQQMAEPWQTHILDVVNKLFAFGEVTLSRETCWLLGTIQTRPRTNL